MAEVDRIAGTLLGTALGDALGLAAEGMSARAIVRRFGRVERSHLIGRTGFVSDDTEQAALVAQCLVRHPDDVDRCVLAFRRSLLGWFCRVPWGVGRATVRACVRIDLGLTRSGVMSAGNGATMRAAIVGIFFDDHPIQRERFGRALTEVTHRDPRAVEGALYVAELAAACAGSPPGTRPEVCQEQARRCVTVPALGEAIDRARDLALQGVSTRDAAGSCGTSGFVVHRERPRTTPHCQPGVFCDGTPPQQRLSVSFQFGHTLWRISRRSSISRFVTLIFVRYVRSRSFAATSRPVAVTVPRM